MVNGCLKATMGGPIEVDITGAPFFSKRGRYKGIACQPDPVTAHVW